MKINLQVKYSIKGYSQLFNVDNKNIKGRSRTKNTNSFCQTSDSIRENHGSYTSEYRLVKEKEGYIFREVIQDHGISGHHITKRSAIISACSHVELFINETFENQNTEQFLKVEKWHNNRLKCKCQNKRSVGHDSFFCDDCGQLSR